jgi:hypothetical protein
MAGAVQGTQQEFWRPPTPSLGQEVTVSESVRLAEACSRCGTEFLLGSKFCHTCGGRRPEAISSATREDAAAIANVWERGIRSIQTTVTGIKLPSLSRIKLPSLANVRIPRWLHYLHFHEIKSRVGLSTASFIAFVIGLACVAGALLVGLLTVKTLVDWQAIQMYRVEWLLAATASFVVGILLKKQDRDDRD